MVLAEKITQNIERKASTPSNKSIMTFSVKGQDRPGTESLHQFVFVVLFLPRIAFQIAAGAIPTVMKMSPLGQYGRAV